MELSLLSAYFLAGFFTFVAVFYTLRVKTQPKPRQFMGKPGSQHWIGHATFRVFRVTIWAVCVLRIFFESIDQWLFIYTNLMHPVVVLTGIVLMVCGFSYTVLGHFTLGKNWTSGVNPNGPTDLITQGVYGRSRNPMFLGVLVTQLGFFLVLPSGFTLVCLVVGYIAVFNQVKLEEQFLVVKFGDLYRTYHKVVPRWFGTVEQSGVK